MPDTDLTSDEAKIPSLEVIESIELEEIALREERAGLCLCSYEV